MADSGKQLRGQGPALELGLRGETGGGIGTQRFPGTPICPDCGTAGATTERRINFAVGLFLPNALNNSFGFRLRAGATFVTGTNVSDPYLVGIAIVDSSGTPIPAQVNYTIDYSPTQLQFEFLGEYAPASWARMFAGPWGALRLNESYIQTERIVQPANARFVGGENERTVASGSEISPARGTFGIVLGGGVRWQVAPRITLLPDLFARLTFDVRNDIIGFSTATVGGGIGLQVELLPARQSALPPDTPLVLVQPPGTTDPLRLENPNGDSSKVVASAKTPTATIDLFALDSAGNQTQSARLSSQLIRHIRSTMIPSTISCDQLPGMLTAISTATPQWSTDSLTRADHKAVQQQLLLTFAARLRQASLARLVIEGGGSECRNQLRSAMVGALQVEPINLVIGSSRRVNNTVMKVSAIGAGGRELLAPITNEWFVEDIQEPKFSVLPTMDAEAGVRRWSIVVTQQGQIITSRNSDKLNGEATTPAPMLLRHVDGSAPPPLVATFTVEDSVGTTVTAVDTLPVLPPSPISVHQQPESWDWEEIDLWLQTAHSIAGTPDWKQVLKSYAPEIQTKSQVKIVGNRSGGKKVMAILQDMLPQASSELIEFIEEEGTDGVRVLIQQPGKQKRH